MVLINLIVVFLVLRYAPKLTKKMIDKKDELAKDRRTNGNGYMGSYSVSSGTEDFYGTMRYVIPIVSTIFVIILLSVSLDSISVGV